MAKPSKAVLDGSHMQVKRKKLEEPGLEEKSEPEGAEGQEW